MTTIKRTKEWLNRSYETYRQLKSFKKRLSRITHANISRYEQTFTGDFGNSTEAKMIAYAELNEKIDRAEDELRKEDAKTKAVIDQVKTPVHWAVLNDHYLKRWGWQKIAKEYCYSERHILRLHGRALQEVAQFVPEEE